MMRVAGAGPDVGGGWRRRSPRLRNRQEDRDYRPASARRSLPLSGRSTQPFGPCSVADPGPE
jgi:hypothetical protein